MRVAFGAAFNNTNQVQYNHRPIAFGARTMTPEEEQAILNELTQAMDTVSFNPDRRPVNFPEEKLVDTREKKGSPRKNGQRSRQHTARGKRKTG
jgi:hypothetical protein